LPVRKGCLKKANRAEKAGRKVTAYVFIDKVAELPGNIRKSVPAILSKYKILKYKKNM
jgi:hypothetical protein